MHGHRLYIAGFVLLIVGIILSDVFLHLLRFAVTYR